MSTKPPKQAGDRQEQRQPPAPLDPAKITLLPTIEPQPGRPSEEAHSLEDRDEPVGCPSRTRAGGWPRPYPLRSRGPLSRTTWTRRKLNGRATSRKAIVRSVSAQPDSASGPKSNQDTRGMLASRMLPLLGMFPQTKLGAKPRRVLGKSGLVGPRPGEGLVYVAAIPLAPFLYEDNFLILVLLRPTKEVFLAAGFALEEGRDRPDRADRRRDPALPRWVSGSSTSCPRHTGTRSRRGRSRAPWAGSCPRRRSISSARSSNKKGKRFIVLGRIAVMASTLVAAAAGAARHEGSRVPPRRRAGALSSPSSPRRRSDTGSVRLMRRRARGSRWPRRSALVATIVMLSRYLKRS